MSVAPLLAFGDLLRQLRKRAGMTQRDLAAALGYSDSLVSSLEKGQRRPDLDVVIQHLIPALGLHDEPALAGLLVEHAAAARGEHPPSTPLLPRAAQTLLPTARPARFDSVPALPVELIGRSAEVHQIRSLLLAHNGRLVTLVGPPGVGKTSLALASARDIQVHFRDGVLFVPLAAASGADQMAASLVDALAPGDASVKPPQTRAVELLRHRAILLVLDNLEQIDGAGQLIASLLAACPTLTILATSRERLHLRSEQRLQVLSLEASDAVRLFIQRAQAIRTDFAPSADDETVIRRICRHLGYLPLAIELSAVWVHGLSFAEIASEIEHNLHFLSTTLRDVPERHRSLYAVYEHSWKLLSLEEQIAFARLSVFRSRFSQEASASVAEVALPILFALIDKSLLTRTAHDEYEMHECGRQFAAEKLKERGESATIQLQHSTYFEAITRDTLQQLRPTFLRIEGSAANESDIQPHSITSAPVAGRLSGIRILMLSWEYPPYVTGGSGKHVTELVPVLSQSRVREGAVHVGLLAPRFAGGQPVEHLSDTLSVYRLDVPSELRYPFAGMIPNQELLVEQVTKLVNFGTYDLVHVQDWRFAKAAIALKRMHHLPLLATYHVLERMRYQQTLPAEIFAIDDLERELAQEVAHIIVCSDFMRRDVLHRFGMSPEKISVIPNGIRSKSREYIPSDEQQALRRRHAPTGGNLLLFVGSALLEKGLSVLIRAMPYILADHRDTRLVVAGKDCDKLLPLAYELKVDGAIDFVGFVSDQYRDGLYQTVDALIIPSLYEPFGIVALEAMAFGCHVVASEVGGLGEVVRDQHNGLTFRPNDPQSLAHAIHLLLMDPAAAQRRTARALDDIRVFYQWSKIATQTARIYHDLATVRR